MDSSDVVVAYQLKSDIMKPVNVCHELKTRENPQNCVNLLSNKNILHYPTLRTVIMVENVIKNSKMPMRKADIKRKLDTKIMHQTLGLILSYLESRNMIINYRGGYVWIYNPSPKLRKAIREGREV